MKARRVSGGRRRRVLGVLAQPDFKLPDIFLNLFNVRLHSPKQLLSWLVTDIASGNCGRPRQDDSSPCAGVTQHPGQKLHKEAYCRIQAIDEMICVDALKADGNFVEVNLP